MIVRLAELGQSALGMSPGKVVSKFIKLNELDDCKSQE